MKKAWVFPENAPSMGCGCPNFSQVIGPSESSNKWNNLVPPDADNKIN